MRFIRVEAYEGESEGVRGELWDSMQVSNPGGERGRKEGWRGKFLTRWCNSKDICEANASFRTGSPPWALSICTFSARLLKATCFLMLNHFCRAK